MVVFVKPLAQTLLSQKASLTSFHMMFSREVPLYMFGNEGP